VGLARRGHGSRVTRRGCRRGHRRPLRWLRSSSTRTSSSRCSTRPTFHRRAHDLLARLRAAGHELVFLDVLVGEAVSAPQPRRVVPDPHRVQPRLLVPLLPGVPVPLRAHRDRRVHRPVRRRPVRVILLVRSQRLRRYADAAASGRAWCCSASGASSCLGCSTRAARRDGGSPAVAGPTTDGLPAIDPVLRLSRARPDRGPDTTGSRPDGAVPSRWIWARSSTAESRSTQPALACFARPVCNLMAEDATVA
jgi:hypothetical protein